MMAYVTLWRDALIARDFKHRWAARICILSIHIAVCCALVVILALVALSSEGA